MVRIQGTIFACTDFIAQSILVRTAGPIPILHFYSNLYKDIPLLDCVGSKDWSRDRPFDPCIHVPRSVKSNLHSEPSSLIKSCF